VYVLFFEMSKTWFFLVVCVMSVVCVLYDISRGHVCGMVPHICWLLCGGPSMCFGDCVGVCCWVVCHFVCVRVSLCCCL